MSTRDEHLSPTQFAPPSPKDRAAPISRHMRSRLKMAQDAGKAWRGEQQQSIGTPPSGWPTVQQVEDHGILAFNAAHAALPDYVPTENHPKGRKQKLTPTEDQVTHSQKRMLHDSKTAHKQTYLD